MKRLLSAFLILALGAASVDAKTLVVVPNSGTGQTNGTDVFTHVLTSQNRVARMWLEILKRTTAGQNGGTYGYSVVMENKVNTHDVRTGLMRWNLGKSSQRSEQFDAVIILNGQLVFSTGASLGALKGDSLLEIRANGYDGPTVPILYGLSDRGTILGTGKSFSSAPCTTGVSSDYSAGAEAGIFYKTGSTRGWITAGQFNGYMTRSSAVPSGGFRQLINEGSGRFPFQVEASGIFCNWCDSLSNYAANDSVVIWEVPYTYKTGGSTVIFDYADGNGDVPDSLVNFGATVTDQPAEGDAALMLMGLARLDSLSGHKVFDPAKLPIRLGVTVDAAVCNTANRAGPGIIPSDSSVVKATIDSIVATNALGGVQIKLTVGVNVDSLQGGAKYNSQLGWWRRLGMNVRFSPQVWPGVTTLIGLSSGNSNINHPVDAFGFRRARRFASDLNSFSTADEADADSSIDTHLKWMNNLMVAAGITREERSHTLLPPLDDWCPNNIPTQVDSMYWVLLRNGYRCIRSDGRSWAGPAWRGRNQVAANSMSPWGISGGGGALGYEVNEGRYHENIGNGTITVLAHNGYPINGGTSEFVRVDSTTVPMTAFVHTMYLELNRTWTGLTQDREYSNVDAVPPIAGSDWGAIGQTPGVADDYFVRTKDQKLSHVDIEHKFGPAHIRKFNAADFSGVPNGPPSRHAYWILKSLKNQFDTINDFAGRTVIEFAWPEDITP